MFEHRNIITRLGCAPHNERYVACALAVGPRRNLHH